MLYVGVYNSTLLMGYMHTIIILICDLFVCIYVGELLHRKGVVIRNVYNVYHTVG